MDILKYKDYEGTAELDMTRQVCRGKILFIGDLVTYEASTPIELQREFEAAVDDYIETCSTLNKAPQKPLKGQFNVRIPPILHKAVVLRAMADGTSINEVVVRALDAFVIEGIDSAIKSRISPEETYSLASSGVVKVLRANYGKVTALRNGPKLSQLLSIDDDYPPSIKIEKIMGKTCPEEVKIIGRHRWEN